jgi:hypothetical protein
MIKLKTKKGGYDVEEVESEQDLKYPHTDRSNLTPTGNPIFEPQTKLSPPSAVGPSVTNINFMDTPQVKTPPVFKNKYAYSGDESDYNTPKYRKEIPKFVDIYSDPESGNDSGRSVPSVPANIFDVKQSSAPNNPSAESEKDVDSADQRRDKRREYERNRKEKIKVAKERYQELGGKSKAVLNSTSLRTVELANDRLLEQKLPLPPKKTKGKK